jgi:hypothetical protein
MFDGKIQRRAIHPGLPAGNDPFYKMVTRLEHLEQSNALSPR